MISILMIISIFFLSCKDEEILPETQLKLDLQEIKVDATKTKKTIKVDSNSGYIVKSEVSWVKVLDNKDKTKIEIEISENATKDKRFGGIIVTTKDDKVKETIKVYQEGAVVGLTPKLTVLQTVIEVKPVPVQANCKIDLTSNVTYETKVNVSWINVLEDTNTMLTFNVEENKTGSERTGVISFLINGELKSSVDIKQSTNNSYVSPNYNFAFTENEIKAFETNRGNVLTDTSTPAGGQTTILKYDITDPIFSQISYLINLNVFVKATLYTKDAVIDPTDKEKYEDSLLSQGYEKITEKGYLTSFDFSKVDKIKFVNKENGTKIEFMADARANHYVVTYYPVQSSPSSTLSSLPTFTKWDSKANVESFEAANNGVLDNSNSKFDYVYKGVTKDKLFYNVTNANDYLVAREYYVAKSGGSNVGVSQKTLYYNSRSLVFYTGKDGESYVTDEFKQLLQDNGYTFQKTTSKKSHIFVNGTKKLAVTDYKHTAFYDKVIRLNLY